MLQNHDFEMKRLLIKEGLGRCTQGQRVFFCRMYAPEEYHKADADPFLYNIEKLAKYNIDIVVDNMPWHKLDHALVQLDRTLRKNNEVQQTGI